MVSLSTVLAGGQLALSAFGALGANKQAKKSAAQSQALTQAQIDAIDRSNELSDAGGAALQQALGRVLMELGSRGTYDPAIIDDLASLLAQENKEGAAEVAAQIKQAALQGGGRSNQQLLNALDHCSDNVPTNNDEHDCRSVTAQSKRIRCDCSRKCKNICQHVGHANKRQPGRSPLKNCCRQNGKDGWSEKLGRDCGSYRRR